ncbi:hypothetical protein QFC22_001809 [Naganishia vaughanmartiniae]|uniref:Uncharacterized protein n=1 Tax=Naganishia vaughanmartiniae TaxID=1424756 RepID=A0ACC2XI39_9TREE|nr:hypothetical protein QFC22_001809 [Naganishia vaughanmartiniae]
MKFSIVAVALFAAILGKASPVPQDAAAILTNVAVADAVTPKLVTSDAFANHDTLSGNSCSPGLKVSGYSRLADYTVRGHDFSGASLAALYNQGKFDNFGGPIIAGALAQAGYLPSTSRVFVQSQNANYFYHKQGSVAEVIKDLSPDTGYATYVQGSCSQFSNNAVLFAHCCQ